MGSVGDDYVCPHCDGQGYGGYAPDGVNYPICTEGTANCLDKLMNQRLSTRAMVKRSALKMVFVIRHFQEEEGYDQETARYESRVSHIVNIVSQRISDFL